MPEPSEEEALTPLAFARTSPAGEPGLTLSVEVAGGEAPVQIPPSVQRNINVTWQPGQLPFGVPTNRDATFTWSGILMSSQDADFQIAATPNAAVTGMAAVGIWEENHQYSARTSASNREAWRECVANTDD